MELQGSRQVQRRRRAQVFHLSEDDAVTYLLTRHAAIFKFKINSTDEMHYDTNGDGRCGNIAIGQAAQRAQIPIEDTSAIKKTLKG